MKNQILIIEDDEAVRSNTKILLDEEGYTTLTAKNGELGVKIAREMIPNLIICDIMMPGMSGYEVLDNLSKNSKTNSIPFLFLSAKVEISDLRRGMELGADDYLFKPYKSEDLIKAIEIRLRKFDRIKAKLVHEKKSKFGDSKKEYHLDDSLFININNKPKFIKIDSIKYISSENQYSNLGLKDGSQILLRKSLSAWEKILPQNHFLRIHRSTIINLNFVAKVEKWQNDSFKVYLHNHHEPFVISKRYASSLKEKNLSY